MRTTKETVSSPASNPFANVFSGDNTQNKTRDVIITAVEASLRSNAGMPVDKRVPVLFFSNPGFGKTTTIYNYAKKNGYHVEVLCGAQYAQDEILGFQTNEGGKSLVIKEPEWYSRIIENHENSKPSILFLDELSAVSGSTQGALYQLCFERRIRGGKSLPDDCLVVAAANYKQNLPGYSEMTAPTLNRFCIINLLPENAMDVVTEFAQGVLEDPQKDWPEFDHIEMTKDQKLRIVGEVAQTFRGLFNNYTAGSNKGFLDIKNIYYDGIYDRDDQIPEVLNFISLRTMSYLTRIIIAFASMGVKSTNPAFRKAVNGLIGLGTNTWGDAEESTARINKYLNDIYARFSNILDNAIRRSTSEPKKVAPTVNKLLGKDSIANRIVEFVAEDNLEKYLRDDFAELITKIADKYDTEKFADIVPTLFKSEATVNEFRADMDEIEILISDIESAQLTIGRMKPYLVELTRILKYYRFYYESAKAGTM